MKISCERDALLRQLQTVSRVASTRSAIQALSGVQLAAVVRRLRTSGHRHGRRPTRPAGGRDRPRGRRRVAGAAAPRRGPPASGRAGLARASRRRAGRRTRLRQRDLPHPDAPRRGLPAVPRAPGRRRRVGSAGGLRVNGAQGRKLGLARRDPPSPDRDSRVGFGPRAPNGRHRLLSTEREGDDARGCAAVWVRGQRAGAGPAGAGPRRGSCRGRGAPDQRSPESGAVRAREGRAVLAA